MKAKYLKLSLILLVFCIQFCPLFSQGTFQNLNFEAANIAGYPVNSSMVPIANALPGWSGSYSNVSFIQPTTQVWYDGISIGGAMISVNDTNTFFGFVPLQGNFSLNLFGGAGNSAEISQTGLVPTGTKSLQILAGINNNPFVVSLGGQIINMVPLVNFSDAIIYGGDISSFAGQTEELTLTELSLGNPSRAILDDIVFSIQPIPEPGTCALLLCGTAVLAGVSRWKRANKI